MSISVATQMVLENAIQVVHQHSVSQMLAVLRAQLLAVDPEGEEASA